MSLRFLISLKKWPLAIQKAFSQLNEASQNGETRIVDFQLGPPQDGELPLRLFIDGRRALLCRLNDTSLSFLHDMREWMERCLVFDQEGTLHPEVLTLNCTGLVLHLAMVHVGWDEVDSRAKPISYFVVIRSDWDDPAVCCFCDTLDTLRGLYHAVMDCLRRFRSLFDNQGYWYDVKRLDMLHPVSTTDRMLTVFYSKKLEIKLQYIAKSNILLRF